MALVRESYLLRIGTPTPVRVWSGVGDLSIPNDAVEPVNGAIYLGAGQLLSAPDFQQLINGLAERLEFVISGVSEEATQLALEEAEGVKNAAVHVGRIDFDANWQRLGAVEWEATFRADVLTLESDAQAGTRVRTLKVSVGTADTGRSYAPVAFFTDADQRLRSPTDAFFDHVAGINAGTSRIFGPRTESE